MTDCSNVDAGDNGDDGDVVVDVDVDVVVAVVDAGDCLVLEDEELYLPVAVDFGGGAPGAMVES